MYREKNVPGRKFFLKLSKEKKEFDSSAIMIASDDNNNTRKR